MLKYLQCEKILEPQNDHLKQQRESYQACLKSFESINSHIHEIKNPSPKRNISQQEAYNNKKPLQLIDYIQKKYKNLETYISRARSNIHLS